MESALYGIYALVVFVSEISLVRFLIRQQLVRKYRTPTLSMKYSLYTRGSHREVSAAVSSVFVCQYDNGDITNLFLSPRIDRIRSTEKQS